ncbi:MAG: hypothetical protein Kow00107_09680 [Planctomycetota bacterium]
MKSRLDGFKVRSRDSRVADQRGTDGSGLARVGVFFAVLTVLVAVLFVPDNPLLRYRLGAEASEAFRARIDFMPPDAASSDPIPEGTVLISRGEIVDKVALDHLSAEAAAYNELHGGFSGFLSRLGSLFLIVLATLSLFVIYFNDELMSGDTSPLRLLYMGMAVAGALLCGRIMGLFFGSSWWVFTPLSIVTIVVGLSLSPAIAGAAAIFSFPIFLTAFNPSPEIAIAVCSSAAAAPFLTKRARKRNHLLRAGFILGCLHVLIIVAFGMFLNTEFSTVLRTSIYGFIIGIATGAAATFILPVVEWLFGVITEISLIELSDLNHPLLKRMLLQASGTYQHSLIVATIAEHAAESIGANALLCKVGSLFHDIGKMVRPKYFVENNPEATRLHDKLKYSLSAMLIISHTKDGAELGKEYNLPQPILDIIVEHQGTTKVEYFYNKALQSNDSLSLPDEQFFMYPGPKPRSKESAIVMIADSVEALSRTLKNPTSRRIQDAVHSIIMKKLNDGQFDECDITLAELKTVEKSISWIVQSMFHQRIEYPRASEKKPKVVVEQEELRHGEGT